jgi:hypothetical protein
MVAPRLRKECAVIRLPRWLRFCHSLFVIEQPLRVRVPNWNRSIWDDFLCSYTYQPGSNKPAPGWE